MILSCLEGIFPCEFVAVLLVYDTLCDAADCLNRMWAAEKNRGLVGQSKHDCAMKLHDKHTTE